MSDPIGQFLNTIFTVEQLKQGRARQRLGEQTLKAQMTSDALQRLMLLPRAGRQSAATLYDDDAGADIDANLLMGATGMAPETSALSQSRVDEMLTGIFQKGVEGRVDPQEAVPEQMLPSMIQNMISTRMGGMPVGESMRQTATATLPTGALTRGAEIREGVTLSAGQEADVAQQNQNRALEERMRALDRAARANEFQQSLNQSWAALAQQGKIAEGNQAIARAQLDVQLLLGKNSRGLDPGDATKLFVETMDTMVKGGLTEEAKSIYAWTAYDLAQKSGVSPDVLAMMAQKLEKSAPGVARMLLRGVTQ